MKILGISCSPRAGGNTEIIIREALSKAEEEGAQTELVTLAQKNIAPCDACLSCLKTGKCHKKDDMQDIYRSLEEADGIILGTPSYFNNVSAQAKAVMDRTYLSLLHGKLRGKVAAAIVADLPTAFELFTERLVAGEGDWVWITGPWRTADIAKVLVLGAHGPNALQVLVLE